VMNAVKDCEVYFEQPCETLEQCRHVRSLTRQPLILDECIHDAEDLYRASASNTAQAIGLKIARVGGLSKARHLRDYCVNRGIQMNIEDVGGSQIADTAAMHLAMATPDQYLRASWNACRHHSIVTAQGGSSVVRGIARLGDAPGLGLRLCADALGDAVAIHE
jgi:L-alanine-DL-glutamate epimerase-like enolase superfamily enzyme